MSTTYETDIVAWANEQAALLRAGKLSQLDIEHIADEVEDVGKSEQRELASRMAILLAHLLKWQFQSAARGVSWRVTIKVQREAVARRLEKTPSLRRSLENADWIQDVWSDAVEQATRETGLGGFPETCPWTADRIVDLAFLPEN